MAEMTDEEKKKKDRDLAILVQAMLDAQKPRDEQMAEEHRADVRPPQPRLDDSIYYKKPSISSKGKNVDISVEEPSLERSDAHVTVGEPRITSREPEHSVNIRALEPRIMSREEGDDAKLARQILSREARPYSYANKASDRAANRADAPGFVYLQNTHADGTKERGVKVKRSQFSTDEDFDKFVSHQREDGNVFDEEAPATAKSGGGGGTFRSRVLNAVGALTAGATPMRDSAFDGGSEVDNARRVFAGAADDVPSREPAPASGKDGGDYARKIFGSAADFSSPGKSAPREIPLGQMDARQEDPELRRLLNTPESGPGPVAATPSYAFAGGSGSFPAGSGNGAGGGPGGSVAGNMDAPVEPGPAGSGSLAPPGAVPRGPMQGPSLDAAFTPAPPVALSAPAAAPRGPSYPPIGSLPKPNQGLDQEMADNASLMTQAIKHSGEIDKAKFAREGELRQAQENEIAKQQLRFQQQMEYVQAGQQKVQNTINEAQQVLNNPAKTPDPERYWDNHSKIMFAIGVGLLAQSGRDIGSVIGNVNSAIDRDVEAQKQEFEAPRDAAKAKIAGAQLMYAQLRDQGHDAYTSSQMTSALMKDFYANQIDKLAANSNSDQAVNNAAIASGDLRQKSLVARQNAMQHEQASALAEFTAKDRAQEWRAQLGARASAAGAKGAGGGRPLPEGQVNALAALRSGAEKARQGAELFSAATDNGAMGSTAINTLTKHLPPSMSKAGDYQARITSLRQDIGKAKEGGILRAEDEKKYREMIPESDKQGGATRWQQIQRDLEAQYQGHLDTLQRAGYDVSALAPTVSTSSATVARPPSWKPE